MIAKWLRTFAIPSQPYSYVTLGGTELFDVVNLAWIDRALISRVRSYEDRRAKFILAQSTVSKLKAKGVDIELIQENIFSYRRELAGQHIYFVDLQGILGLRQYVPLFQEWFTKEIIQPGDFLLITSYLGRKPSWPRVLNDFEGDFISLGISSDSSKKQTYEIAHPILVLNRALLRAGLNRELGLRCFGHIRYSDTSPMGLYGVVCEEGETRIADLINDIPWFNTVKRDWFAP